jgi:hypothetical protein
VSSQVHAAYTRVYPKISGLRIITKYKLKFGITRWEATHRVMTHKIAIQLHLVSESCTICSSRSRRPVRKLLGIPSYKHFRSRVLFRSTISFLIAKSLGILHPSPHHSLNSFHVTHEICRLETNDNLFLLISGQWKKPLLPHLNIWSWSRLFNNMNYTLLWKYSNKYFY